MGKSWWCHQMEKFSALLALCAGNSPVTGEFPSQRPVTQSFDVFFDLRLKNRFSKQPRRQWFEMLSGPLWRHCNDVAQLQTKMVPINLIWSESAQWLLSYGAHNIPGALITPMGMPIMPWWANDPEVACLEAKTVPVNLIWRESIHWLLISGIRKIPGTPYHTHDHVHYAPMGKWPRRCISTGQYSSIEPDLEWIGPLFAEFWHPQDSRSSYHAHGHAHYALMAK